MRNDVTVVAPDKLIIVDNQGLIFDFPRPDGLHALQWHSAQGHMEFTDGRNVPLSLVDYNDKVLPFVQLWDAEKARLDAEAEQSRQEAEALYNSEEERAKRVRTERAKRVGETDYLMTTDYPLPDGQREPWTVYRQDLRDLPSKQGFPWDGDVSESGTKIPWPVKPF